ncbi:MAG: NADH:flavin oxidoreductase [Spirochaetes bacterium]|nr:NADH:flavin oxidoreductase [Spirochaetota bacterium]
MENALRFGLKTLADLDHLASKLAVSIPHQEDVSVLFESVPLPGGLTLPNRFVVHPMEGFDADPSGTPSELAFRRYRRYAEGGAALIWFEATAVVPEGRSNPAQFWMHAGNLPEYRRLVESTRAAGRAFFGDGPRPLLVLQLTHSGRYSKPEGTPVPMIAHHSAVLDPIHKLTLDTPLVTDEYLDRLQDAYVASARLARDAGFDGVDVKACHRYLVSELLASHHRENSRYGGSLENRARFLLETAAKIRDRVPEVFVTTRLNVFDAIPYPWGFGVSRDGFLSPDLSEPLQVIEALRKIGAPLLNHSIGNPYYNPHWGRPYDQPSVGVPVDRDRHPLQNTAHYFDITRRLQEANAGFPIIGGGYGWLREFAPPVMAALVAKKWVTLVGQGRNSFAYPEGIRDLRAQGAFDKRKVCITCSRCTQIMRDGGRTGCAIRDVEIYGKEYKEGRARAGAKTASA